MLKNSKDVVKLGDDTQDRSYINKWNEGVANCMATESDTKTEKAKWLVMDDFNVTVVGFTTAPGTLWRLPAT